MITYDKITDIFCIADEFCKNFEKTTRNFILGKRLRRLATMSNSGDNSNPTLVPDERF